MSVTYDDPLELLGEKHIMGIITFLDEKGRSTKSEIYESVARNGRMVDKLEALERYGLIVMDCHSGTNRAVITLTDKGRRVAELIRDLRRELGS